MKHRETWTRCALYWRLLVASILLAANDGCGGTPFTAAADPMAETSEDGSSASSSGDVMETDVRDAGDAGDAGGAVDSSDATPAAVCIKGESAVVTPGTGPLACGTDAGESCLITCGDDGQWETGQVCANPTFYVCECPDAEKACSSTGTFPCDVCGES